MPLAIGARPARAPGGGIAARSGASVSSAECTFYEWDGSSFTLGTETVTVRNSYTSSVGASADIWVVFWAGSWWVLTEGC